VKVDIGQALITPLLATIVTALAVAVIEWLRARDEESRGRQNLDLATRRVEFLNAWMTMRERTSEEGREELDQSWLRVELDSTLQLAEQAWTYGQRDKRRVTPRQLLQTILLAYTPMTWQSRLVRVLYWASLALATLVLTLQIGNPSSWLGFIVIEFLVLIVVWSLRMLTLRLTRQSEGSSS
jgi:hypothetical protein